MTGSPPGTVIRHNVFYGEGKRGGISLSSIGNRVYNNTFVGSTPAVRGAYITGDEIIGVIPREVEAQGRAKGIPRTARSRSEH